MTLRGGGGESSSTWTLYASLWPTSGDVHPIKLHAAVATEVMSLPVAVIIRIDRKRRDGMAGEMKRTKTFSSSLSSALLEIRAILVYEVHLSELSQLCAVAFYLQLVERVSLLHFFFN